MTPEVREEWMKSRVKHGGYLGGKETSLHSIWRTMLARCGNPNNKCYDSYGGRGITVCAEWLQFENFKADMEDTLKKGLSLERKNNNLGYSKDNCVWATRSEQQKNKTSTRLYTNGVFTGTLVEVATYVGVSKELAFWRFRNWGTFEKGLSWQELPKI